MKIRNGFVSNSSSSSFVVAYKSGDPCPHCGRKDIDMVEFFDRMDRTYSDSTHLEHSNFEAVIKEYQDNIDRNKKIIDQEKMRPQSDLAFDYDGYSGNFTVADYIKDLENDNKSFQDFCNEIKKVVKEGWAVIEVRINNDDMVSEDILKDGQENGTVLILEKTGD